MSLMATPRERALCAAVLGAPRPGHTEIFRKQSMFGVFVTMQITPCKQLLKKPNRKQAIRRKMLNGHLYCVPEWCTRIDQVLTQTLMER